MTNNIKVHKPILDGAVVALHEIFGLNAYADKTIERNLKFQRKWGSRDRRQFAEIVYDCVRWWRLILEVGLGKPFGADVTEALCHAVVTFYLEEFDVSVLQKRASTWPVRQSASDELCEVLAQELGAAAEATLASMNQKAPQFLRMNLLKTTRDKLLQQLRRENIELKHVDGVETALVLVERKNVFQTEAFKWGWFEMQDGGSQQVAPLLAVEPGERVIDACAGAGGKTLHLAALMKNQGRIIAMDVNEKKLDELKLRARRAGVSIIETRVIESTKAVKRLADSADRVLLDVPCSGLGVIRRYPDTKWKFSRADLKSLSDVQNDILDRYTEMVRVGGALVYATCSILPSENEGRLKAFVERSQGQFEIEEELFISPVKTLFDGFYAARLRRKTSHS